MKTKVKYDRDENFTTYFSNNAIYTFSNYNYPNSWACVHVGEQTATGHRLTQEIYDSWESNAEFEGEFDLDELCSCGESKFHYRYCEVF